MTSRNTLWVDGSAGASGDMILGMLVDLGVAPERLERALRALPLAGWSLETRRVERCGLSAAKVDVRVDDRAHGRGFEEIRRIVGGGDLPAAVRDDALAVFHRLVEAEARAHGRDFERTHLHEAGSLDAIVDVVGACVGLHALGVERLVVSRLTTGFGSVHCAHGDYPVPGPATLNLIEGVPCAAGTVEAERLTPTGAAILTTLADAWGPLPPMRVSASGYGAGDRDLEGTPNVLRGALGREDASAVTVIETSLDDATPQLLAHALGRLLAAGALDAHVSALTMKKGRPGHGLTVLARPEDAERLARLVLRETPALGLRYREERRVELERAHREVATAYGTIRVKLGLLDGLTVNAWPEYEDCATAAEEHDVTLAEVQQAALAAWRRRNDEDTRE